MKIFHLWNLKNHWKREKDLVQKFVTPKNAGARAARAQLRAGPRDSFFSRALRQTWTVKDHGNLWNTVIGRCRLFWVAIGHATPTLKGR